MPEGWKRIKNTSALGYIGIEQDAETCTELMKEMAEALEEAIDRIEPITLHAKAVEKRATEVLNKFKEWK